MDHWRREELFLNNNDSHFWPIFASKKMDKAIASLHLVVLPSVSGGYNDECFLPDEKLQMLRIMVQNISRAFDKFGDVYWLDYGKF